MWEFSGQRRPPFAEEPGPGQESVWDYPRPPALVQTTQTVTVAQGEAELARTTRGYRVLETASPPTFYIPAADCDMALLKRVAGHSFCEWKGAAQYWALATDSSEEVIAWCYPEPSGAFLALAQAMSFYPGRVTCHVDGERVRPQAGGFYGGWITDAIVGPCKGEPGTGHW